MLSAPWPAQAQSATPLEAYASATSVKQGATLDFCVRDPAGSLTVDATANITVIRIAGWVDLTLLNASFPVRNRSVPANAASAGCGWPVSYRLTVPADWRSGLYYAFFQGAAGTGCCVPFVVRAAVKTATAKLLVQVPVSTAQAFNTYGGNSLLDEGAPYTPTTANQVSFDRPLADRWNYCFDPALPPLVRWLEKSGFPADYCSNIDLHQDPTVTAGYGLLVIAGRDAFWTREQRNQFDRFVAAGGNAAILGGNTAWWQARLAPNSAGTPHRSLVCYKFYDADPDPRLAYKTYHWTGLQPPEPENTSLGLGTSNGTFWRGASPPSTPYTVATRHWLFDGTGLQPGDRFGAVLRAAQLDSLSLYTPAVLTTASGTAAFRYFPFGSPDPSPDMMTLVAHTNVQDWWVPGAYGSYNGGARTFTGIFSRGGGQGTVFNAGHSDWTSGLKAELAGLPPDPISRITRNLLTRLSNPHTESAEVRHYRNTTSTFVDIHRYVLGSRQRADGTPDITTQELVEDTPFRAHPAPLATTVPVYRHKWLNRAGIAAFNRFRLSLKANVGNGWVPDGIAFHAFSTPQPGTVPVYQHHRVQSVSTQEMDAGWYFQYSPLRNLPGLIFDDLAFYAPLI